MAIDMQKLIDSLRSQFMPPQNAWLEVDPHRYSLGHEPHVLLRFAKGTPPVALVQTVPKHLFSSRQHFCSSIHVLFDGVETLELEAIAALNQLLSNKRALASLPRSDKKLSIFLAKRPTNTRSELGKVGIPLYVSIVGEQWYSKSADPVALDRLFRQDQLEQMLQAAQPDHKIVFRQFF